MSVISRYRLYQILSYLLHERCPSNFGLLNFVKNFRNICLKKYRIYQKLTSFSFTNLKPISDIVNLEKIFKNYEDYLLSLKITENSWKSSKNLAIFGDVIIGQTPSPSVIYRHHLETPPSRWWRHIWMTIYIFEWQNMTEDDGGGTGFGYGWRHFLLFFFDIILPCLLVL
jgi:hypothetical protein